VTFNRDRIASYFAERDFSRSGRFAAGRSGHRSANGFFNRDRIASYFAERDFSRSGRFAAGRSGHRSANGFFNRDRIASYFAEPLGGFGDSRYDA